MKEIEARLQGCLSTERYRHTLRVRGLALRLAEHHGICRKRTALAALFHDWARELDERVLLKKTCEFGIVIDEIEKRHPVLLHGPVGACMVREEYGPVVDTGIIDAIYYHTTGRGGCSPLEAVIFLADCLEPGRSYPERENLEKLTISDLHQGLLKTTAAGISYQLKQGFPVHPRTLALYNSFLL